jgi:hypothetical protein
MFTYRILNNLPDVPEIYIEQALEKKKHLLGNKLNDNLPNWYKDRKLIINGKEESTTHQQTADVDNSFTKWCIDHIHPRGFDCQVSMTDHTKGTHWGPHTDLTREFTLIYLLESGGPGAETVFYFEPGKLIRRTGFQEVCNDYDKLIVLERNKFPLYKWVIIDAMVLHGVENIQSPRISFQISANDNPYF